MRDADHVDLAHFYARAAGAGRWFRLAGLVLAGAAGALAAIGRWDAVGGVLAVAIVAWLFAWRIGVGALWRSALVAAIAVAAAALAAHRLSGAAS